MNYFFIKKKTVVNITLILFAVVNSCLDAQTHLSTHTSAVFLQQGQQEPAEGDEANRGGAGAGGAAAGAGTAAAAGASASPGKQSSSGERKAKKESKDKDKCVIL